MPNMQLNVKVPIEFAQRKLALKATGKKYQWCQLIELGLEQAEKETIGSNK